MISLHELTNAQHSIQAFQGGTWTIDSITNAVTVSATNLDIRDLAFATDSVTAHQGGTWNINSITNPVTTVEEVYNTWQVTDQDITNTASQIASTPLGSRKRIIIQNVSSNDIYVDDTNAVTTAGGGKIAKGASFEMTLGPSATIWGIAGSGTNDIRVWEFAV